MKVPALRNTTARDRFDRELVAIDQRDTLGNIAQHSRRAQTADGCTNNDGMTVGPD
ncbi:hypothetical protein GCM10010464_53690 [Pseudonocardia yunnanensis]